MSWRAATSILLLAAAALIAGCAARAAPRVTWLGDGVFQSPTVHEAEAYCRNFGAPMRLLDAGQRPVRTGEVSYRCD